MGFLDDLLIGEGPSLQTRSLSTISPEQRAALDQLLTQLRGQPPAAFTGQRNTGLSPFEQASLSALEQRSLALAQPDANLEAAGGAVRGLTDFEGETGDASEFFRTNVQDPLLQSFGREILPQISRQFGGADFFSTERQAAEGLAREDLLEALAGQKSAVELDQFNRARDRALTAAGLAPGLSAAENARTQSQIDILDAAGIEREVEQQGLDRNYVEFVRQQQQELAQNELLARLGLTPTIENLAMTDPGSAGIINILLGGAAGGIGEQLGRAGGDWLTDLLGGLFGGTRNRPSEGGSTDGQSPADTAGGGTGTTVTNLPIPTGGGGSIPRTPGGQVTITDPTTGQEIPSTPRSQNGINLGPMTGGAAGAIAGQIGASLATPAGSTFITEAGGQLANQITSGAATAGVSTAAAESAGSAAGAPAGAGSSIASGVGTALAVAGALYGGYNTVQAARAGDTKNAALSGAATGAAIGSVVPVIGTAVGAVIGALVGAVGAAFGDAEQASEKAYGSYKKLPGEATVRNWTEDQVFGAQFESIKSHTKSGNVKRFEDVSDMFTAFGITKDAHKNIKQVQTKMNSFIEGVIRTAQAAGGLPTDPAALAKLDGQQIYHKLVAPAMAAKVEETTGKSATSNAWSVDRSKDSGAFQGIMADVTDYIVANWGKKAAAVKERTARIPTVPVGRDLR